MNCITSTIVVAIMLALVGCSSLNLESHFTVAPPSEVSLDEEPFTITVPKNLSDGGSFLKGVRLRPFKDVERSGSVRNFSSVSFTTDEDNSELITAACEGDLHDNGSEYESCVYFDSKVLVEDTGNSYIIRIKPYRKRLVQGKSVILLPIELPRVNVANWRRWIAVQSVSISSEYTSEYSTESVKANFDRNLVKNNPNRVDESNAASKQFSEIYSVGIDGARLKVGISIFPYQDGSLVEARVSAEHRVLHSVNSIDWFSVLTDLNGRLSDIVAQ